MKAKTLEGREIDLDKDQCSCRVKTVMISREVFGML